jgi:glycosyltransferase involved in cell wall biosynthesis
VCSCKKNEDRSAAMTILITALSAAKGPSGICRHAYNLVRCALRHTLVVKIYLLIGEWQMSYFSSLFGFDDPKVSLIAVEIASDAVARNRWYLRQLPDMARELRADVVHLSFPVPVRRRLFCCPVIVSLHDLYPYDKPDNFGFPRVIFNRVFLQQCLKEVDVVACVSETTLSRLNVLIPRIAYRKGVVVHNCVDIRMVNTERHFFPEIENEQLFLMVAQHRSNKNIMLALYVFHSLLRRFEIAPDTRLFVIGNEGPETAKIRQFIESEKLQNSVKLIDGLSDKQLTHLYLQCRLLIAPSTVEGFGLPVAEALCHGCHVVCSDIPAFREVGGNSCYYFDLEASSPALEMTQAIHKALDSTRRNSNISNKFSVDSVLNRYVALYERLLENI